MSTPVNHPERQAAVLAVLKSHTKRPITAVEIANLCGIVQMQHESQRKRVRDAVKSLREQGLRICAGCYNRRDADGKELSTTGYWLARSDYEWGCYTASLKASKVFGFIALRKMTEAARDRRTGQGLLFDMRRYGGAASATRHANHTAGAFA